MNEKHLDDNPRQPQIPLAAMGLVPIRCTSCGHEGLLPNGTCKLCPNCGTTTGCSRA